MANVFPVFIFVLSANLYTQLNCGLGIGISSKLSPVVLKLVIEVRNEPGRIGWWLIIALKDEDDKV